MASEPKWTRNRVQRFGAGPRLDALVAEHVMGFPRKPLRCSRRGWWWDGRANGHRYTIDPEDWTPSGKAWDNGTLSWSHALMVVNRLRELGWSLDLEDHTADQSIKPENRSWWYELCHYELTEMDGPGKRKRYGPVYYWQLDGGASTAHVAICRASLCAALVAPTLP